MSATLLITLVFLALALAFTIAAESAPAHREAIGRRYAIAVLFCGYGVCVGVLALIIEYFFRCPAWVAIALPLGFPALLLAGKMGEA